MKTRDQLDISYMYKVNSHKNKLYDGEDMPFGWDFDSDNEVSEFLKDSNLNDFIYLFIKSYKEKYANHIEFSYQLSEQYKMEKKEDYTISYGKSKLRDDIREFEWEVYFSKLASNDFYLNRLKITFASSQNATLLMDNIKQALQGKTFSENGDTLEIADSALIKVKVTTNDFEMWINPDRIVYY